MQFDFFLADFRFLFLEFFFAYFSRRSHVDQRVQFFDAGFIIFLLIGKYRVAIAGLAFVFVSKPLHGPAVEFFRRSDSGQRLFDLFFQFVHFDALLAARAFAFGTVIISVVMNVAVFVFLDFILGRYHAAALAATDHTGVSEGVCFRFGLTAVAEHFLDPIVFVARDHGFVLALMPITTTSRPFEPAVIKGIVKQTVVAATCQVFESPFFNCDFMDPRSGEIAA